MGAELSKSCGAGALRMNDEMRDAYLASQGTCVPYVDFSVMALDGTTTIITIDQPVIVWSVEFHHFHFLPDVPMHYVNRRLRQYLI